MYVYTIVSVLIVSAISLLGVTLLSIQESTLRKYLFIFISIAVGALLGDAFIHLIPEALAESSSTQITSLLIIAGIMAFFVLERFLHWHHHGEDTDNVHIHPVGKLILVSDGVHNFLDGVIIAASFAVSIPVGVATTLAVILHEIPQEIGDFAVLLHAGYSKKQALLVNFLSGLTALLGAVVFFLLAEFAEVFALYLVPLAAGGFIYIALADLIPELHRTVHKKHSIYQIAAVTFGVLMMFTLTFLE
jgi:zinc and cadmium transporter